MTTIRRLGPEETLTLQELISDLRLGSDAALGLWFAGKGELRIAAKDWNFILDAAERALKP
jgi:hypothetical protein